MPTVVGGTQLRRRSVEVQVEGQSKVEAIDTVYS